jgi:hypothetical protein
MRECDVGHHESPREIWAQSQVAAERQPSVGGDGSAVSSTEIVVDAFFASRKEPAGLHAKVGTNVDQELPFTIPVSDKEAACG